MNSIKLAGEEVGKGKSVFVIAEIANAHEGNFGTLKKLVEAAAQAKANAVKFQKYTAAELYNPDHDRYRHFERMEFSASQWMEVIGMARSLGLMVLADVFGIDSANLMHRLGVDGYKLHSSDLLNTPLLNTLATFGKPVLISCGGSILTEVARAINLFRTQGQHNLIVMHGFQAFPTRVEHTELNVIKTMDENFQLPIGFADHIDAEHPLARVLPLLGIAAGASVVEKHITLNRSMKGIDYYSSLNPDEFLAMVNEIRIGEQALGSGQPLSTQEEKIYRQKMKKSLVLNRDVTQGTVLTNHMLEFKRMESAASPLPYNFVVGKKVRKSVLKDTVLTATDLSVKVVLCVVARLNSTRLQRKCLLPLLEQDSIITFLLKRLSFCLESHAVVLCTSTNPADDALALSAEAMHVPVVRGSEDNVMERILAAANVMGADYVVRITGDNPLTDPEMVDKLIRYTLSHNLDYGSGKNLPSGTGAEVIAVPALKLINKLAIRPDLSEYMTWFLDNASTLNVGTMPIPEKYSRKDIRLTMDHLEDYEAVKKVVKTLYKKNPAFTLSDVLDYIDSNSNIKNLNVNMGKKFDRSTINTNLEWTRINSPDTFN